MGGRINEQLQETSGAGALSSRKQNQKNLEVGGGGGGWFPPPLVRRKVKIYDLFDISYQ